ncbi:50S ribosomal protein L29 [bacterium 3DAC]|jgi:large subunit ribosomal protein L29|nr:50S ribosomal protein L29 [Dictyoglomota bacterium]UZN23321.1 50S ribosomal protein L29 [bacterium 3DAC]
MKASELREMTNEELQATLRDLREELFNLRFQHAMGKLKNTARIKQVKKDIARVLTVLGERERGEKYGA